MTEEPVEFVRSIDKLLEHNGTDLL